MIKLKANKNDDFDSEDEKNLIENKAKKIGDIIGQVRRNQEK